MKRRTFLTYRVRLLVILTVILSLPARSTAAQPQLDGTTIAVTSFGDDLALNGNCTLREAVTAANTDTAVDACPAGSGEDTILLPAATITMAIRDPSEEIPGEVPEDDANLSGDFDVTSAITIEGAGMDATILDGDQRLRAFEVTSAGTLTLRNLSVFEAYYIPNNELDGGAIRNDGVLVLDHVLVDHCATTNDYFEDGVNYGAILNTGSLTILYSTLRGNWAGQYAWGGAIASSGSLLIEDSLVEGNDGYYGAVTAGGAVTIRRTVFRDNVSTDGRNDGGAAISIHGNPLLIEDSRFEGIITYSQFAGDVPGITYSGDVTIRRTQFVNNDFLALGGTVFLDQVLLDATSLDARTEQLVVNNSTIRASTAQLANISGSNPDYWVGPLRVNEGVARLEASTVTANLSPLEVAGGELTIVNSTLSGNDLDSTAPWFADTGWDSLIMVTGGALVIESSTISNNHGNYALHVKSGSATVLNSILNATHWPGTVNHADCKVDNGAALTSLGYNIISIATGCGWTPTSGDLLGTTSNPLNPGLFALADNGGPTLTHALRENSIALDAGHPSNYPPADQRGEARPADGNGDGTARTDIGAFESATVPVKLDTFLFLPLLGR